MSGDDAAPGQRYTRSEIRQQRQRAARLQALHRRKLAALTKMVAGITELEQAERELEALREPCGLGWPA